jgi:hypothetical protein
MTDTTLVHCHGSCLMPSTLDIASILAWGEA